MTEAKRVARFELQHVEHVPKTLEPGVLYVAREFGTAAHLCACGCGSKVRTPLGPAAWSVRETRLGPTLHPSVGNWQKPCRSHYLIIRGEVVWAEQWTDEEIAAGRRAEAARREAHFRSERAKRRWWAPFINWLKRFFGR